MNGAIIEQWKIKPLLLTEKKKTVSLFTITNTGLNNPEIANSSIVALES